MERAADQVFGKVLTSNRKDKSNQSISGDATVAIYALEANNRIKKLRNRKQPKVDKYSPGSKEEHNPSTPYNRRAERQELKRAVEELS